MTTKSNGNDVSVRIILGRPVTATPETEAETVDLGMPCMQLDAAGILVEVPNDRYARLVDDLLDEPLGLHLV